MSSPANNPYAPPASAGAPLPPAGPLPHGVRRYRLDPVRHRSIVRSRVIRFYGLLAVLVLLVASAMRHVVLEPWVVIWLGIVVVSVLFGALRIRRLTASTFATYELLVGPRAIRRTIAFLPPCEVLRPEVTAAFETRWGLWLTCETPPAALFVTRAVAEYDELRAALGAEWHGVERVRGWTAWRRAAKASGRQRTRDAVAGTALTADASLAQELQELRHASSTEWTAYPQRATGRRRLVLLLAVWVLLVVMLLAIWQLLSPDVR